MLCRVLLRLARVLPRCKNAMYAYSPYCSLYILTILERRLCGTIGEPLAFSKYSQGEFFQQSRDQELIELVVFFFLLVTLKFDSWVKVEGEIRCQSLQ